MKKYFIVLIIGCMISCKKDDTYSNQYKGYILLGTWVRDSSLNDMEIIDTINISAGSFIQKLYNYPSGQLKKTIKENFSIVNDSIIVNPLCNNCYSDNYKFIIDNSRTLNLTSIDYGVNWYKKIQ